MLTIASLLSIALTVLLTPFFLYLGLIALSAIFRATTHPSGAGVEHGARFLVVIPAHDEEGIIATTVASCREVVYDPALFEIVVIADNCTDATAAAARAAGATVLERNDPERRSKGHALEWFFAQALPARPGSGYDASVIIDADTAVDPGMLSTFSAGLAEGKDWFQAYYTVSNPDSSWRTRMLTYAFSLFNGVWLAGQEGLGLSAALRGNGMCFSTRGLARVPWRAYGLTEDLEFSWRLRLQGERVWFASGTRVFGEMVSRGDAASAAQRRRWEVGRGELRGKFLGPLLRSDRICLRNKALYAIDLLFPPLSTLLGGLVLAASVHLAPWLAGRAVPLSRALALSQGLMAAALLSYALAPSHVVGLPARYFASLLALPYYIAWKALVMMGGRPTEWLRTRREPSSQAGRG